MGGFLDWIGSCCGRRPEDEDEGSSYGALRTGDTNRGEGTSKQRERRPTPEPERRKQSIPAPTEPITVHPGARGVDISPEQNYGRPKRQDKEVISRPVIPSNKGFQWDSNSCYVDSTLFSLMYKSSVFIEWVQGNYPKLKTSESKEIAHKLHELHNRLEREGFCPVTMVKSLRHELARSNPRMKGIMLDVEEFIVTLLKKGLGLPEFIKYNVGTRCYFHQIFVSHKGTRDLVRVQTLLEASMEQQGLKFQGVPSPLLLIKMPRSGGVLQGCRYIVPDLALDMNKCLAGSSPNAPKAMLRAVICLKSMHYTAFVRYGDECSKRKEWVYFDDMGSRVTRLGNFDEYLQTLLDECLRTGNMGNVNRGQPFLEQMLSDIHLCIYTCVP